MRLENAFDSLDAFLGGRPWNGKIPEGPDLRRAMRQTDGTAAAVLQRHAAQRLSRAELSANGDVIGGDVLLAVSAVVHVEHLSLGPEGLAELAATCAKMAAERGLARNLAEDALCSLAARRLPTHPASDCEETVQILLGLSPWSFLDGALESLDDEAAVTVGQWLAQRVLPASRPGRFPLRKLLLRPLVDASENGDPLPVLGAVASILSAVDGHAEHLADFYECYCGWMETRGPVDADLRRVLQRLDLRDVESERVQEGLRAAAFFVVLARLDPAICRRAPRLHTTLIRASRDLALRLPEVSP